MFDRIDATFTHTVTDDDLTYLKWTSEGTLRDGTDFRYDGVSDLESQEEEIGASARTTTPQLSSPRTSGTSDVEPALTSMR